MMLPLLLTTFCSVSTPSASPTSPAPQDAATIEDVEVLRRLLEKALVPARTVSRPGTVAYDRSSGQPIVERLMSLGYTESGTTSVQHARGFHAPGLGVLYSIDLTVPAVASSAPAQEAAAPDGSDAWEAARRELQGGPVDPRLTFTYVRGAQSAQLPVPVVDPAAVDAAIDAVLATLAEHGARVRGLAASETFTVALHLSGSASSWDSAADSGSYDLLLGAIQAQARPVRVVLRVPRQALAGAGGSPDPSELRSLAEITRY